MPCPDEVPPWVVPRAITGTATEGLLYLAFLAFFSPLLALPRVHPQPHRSFFAAILITSFPLNASATLLSATLRMV